MNIRFLHGEQLLLYVGIFACGLTGITGLAAVILNHNLMKRLRERFGEEDLRFFFSRKVIVLAGHDAGLERMRKRVVLSAVASLTIPVGLFFVVLLIFLYNVL